MGLAVNEEKTKYMLSITADNYIFDIGLCRMTLSNSCSSVKVGIGLFKRFDTVVGFRQGDLYHATSST